jgi:hypothetical protein
MIQGGRSRRKESDPSTLSHARQDVPSVIASRRVTSGGVACCRTLWLIRLATAQPSDAPLGKSLHTISRLANHPTVHQPSAICSLLL